MWRIVLAMATRILLLLAIGTPLWASAQPVAVRDLAVLVDASGTETIASVSSADAQQRFVPLAGVFNAGYTHKVHWLRFTLPVAASPWWLEVAPAYLDDLQLFEPTATGFSQQHAGDRLPFSSRPEKFRNFIFKLGPADEQRSTYFLRLQTTSNSMATLQLWQPDDFTVAKATDYLKIGISYGFMLFTLLTNIILWLVLRKPAFGWFALFIFSNLASNFAKDGLMSQYLLPDAPRAADYLVGCTMFFFLSASAPFLRHVLEITRAEKFLFALYRLQVVVPLVMMVFVFTDYFTDARQFTLAFSFLAAVVVLIRSIKNWHADEPETRYVSLGMTLFLLGGMNAVLIVLGLVPGGLSGGTLQQAAYVLAILIFQIALTLRLRRLGELHLQLEQQHARLREEQVLIEQQARTELKSGLSQKIALLEALEQNQTELEKKEFLWRRAIEGSGDGVWDYNVQTGEVNFSDRWVEMLGYEKTEIAGRYETWGNLLHPDDRQRVLSADQASRNGETATFRAEFRMQCKDGSYRWILSRGTVVSRGGDGKALRMIGTHTDLTAVRQAEAKIERMSYYDGLTNLPNTYLFESTLQKELASAANDGVYGAVLFVRLDALNPLNAPPSLRCSDMLAMEIAHRFHAVVRPPNTLARLDSCQYAVIMPRLHSVQKQACLLAEQLEGNLRETVEHPVLINDVQHFCRIQVGIALMHGLESVADVTDRANHALSQAVAGSSHATGTADTAPK